jgi:heat-inducible transcriptional repressor
MPQLETLTSRQADILQAIVNTHIKTAEAVGSRTISRKMGSKLSPASVRNVMADLEEMGFVRQPHTSAGRIPTETGYRQYVDSLMETEEVALDERRRIEEFYRARIRRIEELMELTTKLLSAATHYTAVVQTPVADAETIKRVELVPIASGRVVAIIVTNTAEVRKHIAELPEGTSDHEVERLAGFLNGKLQSLTFAGAKKFLGSLDGLGCPGGEDMAELAKRLMESALSEGDSRSVFLDGIEYIFDQPEFNELSRVRPVLKLLDEKSLLNELLEYCIDDDEMSDVNIRIGPENSLDGVRGCSVVVSPYRVGGKTKGAIGVIGPTRMQYSRACSLVAFVAGRLSHVLTEMSGG